MRKDRGAGTALVSASPGGEPGGRARRLTGSAKPKREVTQTMRPSRRGTGPRALSGWRTASKEEQRFKEKISEELHGKHDGRLPKYRTDAQMRLGIPTNSM